MFSTTEMKRNGGIPLYVSDLPWTVGKQELEHYFAKFGTVTHVDVLFDDKTGFSKGVGYVKFLAPEAYTKAMRNNCHILDGKRFHIAVTLDEKNKEVFKDLKFLEDF